MRAALVVVVMLLFSQVVRSQYSDNFSEDQSLNTALWATDTSLLKMIYSNLSWVEPHISFSSLGMTMAGVTGTDQYTGVQSTQSFAPPFSVRATVMGTVANGRPFEFDLVDGSLSQTISVWGNVGPVNSAECDASGEAGGIWVNSTGINTHMSAPSLVSLAGPTSQLSGVTADLDVWYTITISVDAEGNADVVLANSSGATLSSLSSVYGPANIGQGPFYLILGQFEGTPCIGYGSDTGIGPNAAIWDQIQIVGASAATGPVISAGGVVNSASSVAGPVAPGSIATVYGSFLLSSSSTAPGVPWPTTLGGLSLQFGGPLQAPLYYASGGQSSIQVPWELAGQTQDALTATVNAQTSAPIQVSLMPFAPGIFSMNGQGTGQGAILDSSYKLVDSSNPATAGSTYIQIYCTGLGPVTNQPATGAPASSSPLSSTITTPAVTVGGVSAYVLFSGLAPGSVGLYQVNAQVPAGAPTGSAIPVVISMGGVISNSVNIALTSALSTPMYTVTFTESGLNAIGASWSVTLNGVTQSVQVPAGIQSTISFHVPNGVYSYTANGTPGTCPFTITGTVSVSAGNVAKTISFGSPAFFLPVTSGGMNYNLAVFGDPDKYASLALNNSQPLFAQAEYLLSSVLDPTNYPVSAIEVEDAPGSMVASSAQLIEDALIWAYSYTNQSQLGEPCTLLKNAYQGRSLQSRGIELANIVQWGDVVLDAATVAKDLAGIPLGTEDPAAIAAAFSLVGDILQGWSALEQDPAVKDAAAVVTQLESLKLISSSSGDNYTAAEVLSNLATVGNNPSGLGPIISSLYTSAYQQQISSTASQYAQGFLGQLIPGAEQSLIDGALQGGYNFLLAYGLAQFPANSAVYAASSGFAEAALPGMLVASAGAVIQGYLVPLEELLQAESGIEGAANSVCTASTAAFTAVQSGLANIDGAGAYAATSGFVYALLASWLAYDAQLNKGEQSGAYTFNEILSILGSSLAGDFQLSAQQEASDEESDEQSEPLAKSWINGIEAFFQVSALSASNLVTGACNAGPQNPLPSIASLSPVSAPAGSGQLTLTINGSGFVTSSLVTFNGIPHPPTFVNSGQLTITLIASDLSRAGSFLVAVTNPLPGGGSSNAVTFAVNAPAGNPQPEITSLSPSSAPVGGVPLTLTINGSGFVMSSSVTFNGISHTPTIVSSSELTIALITSDVATAGSFPVVVTNPAPGGGTSNALNFTVTSVSGASASYTVWRSFGGSVGAPTGFIQGKDGNFYGVAEGQWASPTAGPATVFEMDAAGSIQILHALSTSEGLVPASLLQGSDGNFYGKAGYGGDLSCEPPLGCGTVFMVDASGNFTVLHTFSGPDGTVPVAPLIQASDGNLYGTTESGGTGTVCGTAGCGTIFKISPSGTFALLHSFSTLDGADPVSLIQAADGNLYGVSEGSGVSGGSVFKIDFSGNFTLIYSFSVPDGDGQSPVSLIQAGDGDLYGTTFGVSTFEGATSLDGTAFRMNLFGNVTVLNSFAAPTLPFGLMQASDGNFYGLTQVGGDLSCNLAPYPVPGCGTVFKMDSAGNVTILHVFTGGASDGAGPSSLIEGMDGNLWGTTVLGGATNDGVVFRISNFSSLVGTTSHPGTGMPQGLKR
jgi:uncharacterized protein (TIGR03437 family)